VGARLPVDCGITKHPVAGLTEIATYQYIFCSELSVREFLEEGRNVGFQDLPPLIGGGGWRVLVKYTALFIRLVLFGPGERAY